MNGVASTRLITLLVTNAIKLAGVYVAVHEIVSQATPRALELGVAVFMMTGAQVTEEAILNLAGKMFGGKEGKDPPSKSQGP